MSELDTSFASSYQPEVTAISNLSSNVNPLELPKFLGSYSSAPKTIAFVDSHISDAMTVMAGVQADIKILLDPTRDGITQITEALGKYKGLTGVDIISHGNAGELQLGGSFLGTNSLQQYAPDLHKWAASFATGADILLYGCDVAAGDRGSAFVQELSALTGADIAASTDLTGSKALGGNWNLEFETGDIETSLVIQPWLKEAYNAVLHTTAALINAGGSAYTDSLGHLWTADQLFTGGSTYGTAAPIAGTIDDPLFQIERYGTTFSYAIPVANGIYEVNLGFAELYWNTANARVFSVTGEGQSLLTNYDVWTDAGGLNKAIIKKFSVNVTDGILNLNFAASKDQAKVSSIEVIPTATLPGITPAQSGGSTDVTEGGATDTYSLVLNTQPTANVTIALNAGAQLTTSAPSLTFTPANWNMAQSVTVTAVNDTVVEGNHTGTIAYTVSSTDANYNGLTMPALTVAITDNANNSIPVSTFINTGGGAYTDSLGQVWKADQLFTGGATYASGAAIANTTSDPLFQTERTGATFTYAIPVANGLYEVDLGFAELYWNVANARVFSVTGEGQALLSNYDVWTDAGGQNTAVIKKFNVNVTDGILNLNFAASKDQAKVDLIQVTPITPVAGVTPTQSGGNTAVTEGGATDTYSLVLNSQPTANVTVALNAGTQLTTSASSLTFTTANWNVAQTVTVTAVDDTVVEGNHTGTIAHTVTSTDAKYNGLTIAPLTVAITDNDTAPGNTPPSTTGIPNVVVNQGTANTVIDLFNAFSDAQDADAALSYSIYTNTNAALFTAVTIDPISGTLTLSYAPGVTGTSFLTVQATDTGGLSTPVNFQVTINPVSSNPNNIFINTGGGAYTDSLGQVWSADQLFTGGTTYASGAAIANTTSDPLFQTERTGVNFSYAIPVANGIYEVDLGFTELYWNAANARVFSVTGEGQSLLSNYDVWTDAGGQNKAIIKKFNVNVTDGILNLNFAASKDQAKVDLIQVTPITPVPGVTPTQSGGSTAVTEGGATDSYSLVLNTQPTADVTIALNAGAQLTTSATSLTFTPTNWNVAQTVTVTAVNDTAIEGNHTGTITYTVSSTDAQYSGLTIAPLTVAITDNDLPGATLTQTGGSTAVTEGGATDSYSLVLNTQPTANVTVALNPGTQLTTSATSLTFTPANWNVAQTVTVTAVDDTVVEGNHTGTIAHTVTSTDANYSGLSIAPFIVAITDNDANTVPGSIFINTGGGAYTDSLGQVWSADQFVTGGTTYATTAAIANTTSDPLFQTERTGATFTYAIPVANGLYEVDLGFAELYWNVANARVFSVTGEGQALLSNYDVWTDAGGQNTAVIKKFNVNVTDGILNLNFAASKDQAKVDFIEVIPTTLGPGVTLAQTGGSTTVTEGGATDTYNLVLNTQPTANVTIAFNAGTQLTTSATSLTFTPANWNVAQVVTVTAVDDTVVEGNHTGTIAHTVTSTDTNYNGLTIAPLTVAITDNDTNTVPGSIFINAGGAAYTDSLGQVWSADQFVTGGFTYATTAAIANTTSDTLFQDERTGVNFSYAIPVANGIYEVDLGFAEIYWNAANARLFSVTGEGQALLSNYDVWTDAGGQNTAIIKKFNVNVTDGILNLNFAASKDDAQVVSIGVIPTTLLPGVTSAQSGGSTNVTEGGTTDTYSLVLNTQPTANVTVALNPGTQLTTSASSLTFTTANWNVAQTVTVTAVDDTVVEGNHTGTIAYTVSSTDPNYSGLTIAPLTVAITDNDGSPTEIHINSGGGAYTHSTGETYLADQYFSGGGLYATGAAISGTTDDSLFQTERSGTTFAYAIPVINGTYNIDLGFAELYWGAAGKRVFDVTVEGQLAIDDLDIWSQAGQNAALTKVVSGISVTDGVLNISFTASKDQAEVTFIGIHPYAPDSSDPFLHVVIGAPSFAVDYNGNGTEVVSLLGNQSHTHEFGKNLTAYTWQTGSTVLGTTPDINAVLGLGQNSVSLTIGDNNAQPRTLTNSVNVGVYPLNAVGGVLTKYYPTFSSYFPTLLDTLPSSPGFIEVLPSLKVTEDATNGVLGTSSYSGDVIAAMNGKFQATTTGSYTFQVNGGSGQRVFINGTLVTGAIALTAGTKYDIEVRVARSAALTAPIEVLAAVNGGTATAIASSSLTNDESTLKPFINSMPTGGSSLGGEIITIKGVAFFEGDIASQVKVNWGNTVLTGSALTIRQGTITFTTPAGSGTVPVTVQTPNGVSVPVNFTYTAGVVPINFTTPQVVANMGAPTQGTWGPDGRFYVGSVTGEIKAYTFDDNYNVIATQTITTVTGLTNNNILGIAFNPYDATGQPKIYISHSQLFANGGADIPPGSFAPYSGQISVLTGSNFSTVTPLITGLPVSNHDHGINGITFDDAGNLLIAVGSSTNAGIPATPLGSLPESPFSAAILKADITKPNFNGSINYIDPATGQINNNEIFGGNVNVAPGVDVSVYASGLRNPFDIVWTTTGKLYGLDNGANAGFGAASTSATTQGADPNNPDELNLIQQGIYYGHPNRNRGQTSAIQNVYYGPNTASIPGVYLSPLTTIGSSTNGIDEYRATTFNSQLRGNLLGQQWNGTLYNFDLSPDGMQVATSTLPNNPTGLDIVTGPGGALISVDYQDNYITVSKPIDAAATGVTAYDIFPWRAPAVGGGSFVIGGTNFGDLANTTVTIGGQTAILTAVSPTRIKGTLPANSAGASGLQDIVITSAGQTSVIPAGFKYLG